MKLKKKKKLPFFNNRRTVITYLLQRYGTMYNKNIIVYRSVPTRIKRILNSVYILFLSRAPPVRSMIHHC